MNQKQLADKLAKKFDGKRSKMEEMLESAVAFMTEALVKGEKVRLVGFGNFTVKNRKGRVGRNPRTGEKIEIPMTKCPTFVAGFNLKKAVRGK
ncbi:MAG: HU family DNA-binding protein [Candidatus Saganbacteria bacterium]|nr:HU family DNA-binding protein [Candidatus Saganbacteria bacterium]